MITLKSRDGDDLDEEEQEKLRDISEVKIDISKLINVLSYNQDKIERIEFKADKRVTFMINGSTLTSDQLQNELIKEVGLQDNRIIELELEKYEE
ncbi:MAG: hypothetical protein J7K12_02955 [Thermoplasmata archaeon]|nr:hypothetical protein [Thermoplasmata archaeon]